MVFAGADAAFHHGPVDIALARQLAQALAQGVGGPEIPAGFLRLLEQSLLLPELGEDDDPGIEGHQHQNDEGAPGHKVALCPQCSKAVRVGRHFVIQAGIHRTLVDRREVESTAVDRH